MPDNPAPRRRFHLESNFIVPPSSSWSNQINNEENSSPEENVVESISERIRNRRTNTVGQVLDTLGIELESIGLYKDSVAAILAKLPSELGNNFRIHRDGSSEINAYYINTGGVRNPEGVFINAHTEESINLFEDKVSKRTLGYELISVPMNIETAKMTLWALLPALEKKGDFISERCATHIHIGGMKNLGFLKKSLKLGLYFDEIFYSLAHMDGDRFRGYSNNAIYARPLINGPYFKYDRGYYQILNWEQALKAEDIYEFFACYGANVNGEMHKYHPGRYFGINLYSIPRIGTIEFRHFNQCFNPAIVSSVAELCQLFVEIAMRSNLKDLKELEVGDVFKLRSPIYYINKLHKFLDLGKHLDCSYSIDSEDIEQLERVIYNYNGIGIENKEVLTHCKDFEIPNDVFDVGKLIKSKNKPCEDGHIDIHNIKYQSIIK